jgi:hypothetical protein
VIRLALLILTWSTTMAFAHDPEGVPATVEAQMARLYAAAADDINALMARAVRELGENPDRRASQWRQMRAAMLARQVEDRLARLGEAPRQLLRSAGVVAVEAAVRRGEAEVRDLGLGDRTVLGSGSVGFTNVDDDAVRRIAEDSAFRAADAADGAVKAAIDQHGRRAIQVFRSLSDSAITAERLGERQVNQAVARGLISGDPKVTDRAIRELFRGATGLSEADSYRKLGNQIVQVGNATLSVRSYAATVTRTRMREATVAGRHQRLGTLGVNLVQITGRVSDNFCTDYLGLVCSLDGSSGEVDGITYVPIGSLPGGGPPFHPNCSKGTVAFIAELVSEARLRFARAGFETYSQSLAA